MSLRYYSILKHRLRLRRSDLKYLKEGLYIFLAWSEDTIKIVRPKMGFKEIIKIIIEDGLDTCDAIHLLTALKHKANILVIRDFDFIYKRKLLRRKYGIEVFHPKAMFNELSQATKSERKS